MSLPTARIDNELDTIFTPPSCQQSGYYMQEAGAAAVFPPGTVISKAALTLLDTLLASLGHPPVPTTADS